MKVIIESNRLKLRPISLEDTQYVYEKWASNLEVCKHMTWKPHKHLAETVGFVERCLGNMGPDNMTWLIEERISAQIIGCFEARRDGHKIDLGYLIIPDFWGRGYMTEVLKAVIKVCFKFEGVYRIAAVCDFENVASKRVMEKAGMEYEGLLKSWLVHPNMSSEPRDCHSLSITKGARE